MRRNRGWIAEVRNGTGIARRIPDLTLQQRARWLVVAILLPWIARTGTPAHVVVPARLPDGRTVDFRVSHATDLAVIREVLYEGQYALPELEDPALIIDVGSHIGTSVAWFASRYPKCRVVGFEGSPTTYESLRDNVRSFSNVEVHNIAVGARDGTTTFFERAAAHASSLRARKGARSEVTVPILTLESALRLGGPGDVDLLKLDIEGSEYEVLRASPPDPRRVHRIVGEVHTWMDDVPFTGTEFFALLSDYVVEDDESGGDHLFRATPRCEAKQHPAGACSE